MLSRDSSADAVLAALKANADPALIAGMDRVGIRTEHAIGLPLAQRIHDIDRRRGVAQMPAGPGISQPLLGPGEHASAESEIALEQEGDALLGHSDAF